MANYTMTPTAALIYAEWLKRGKAESPRTYLGASIIGHECDRYLWMYFRGIIKDNFDGRMYRLFDRGKREEAVFVNDLRSIGCEVKDVDEAGNQFSVSALGGHFSGHLDGVCKGLKEAPTKWHVTEFKTHSADSFKKLCKDGVKKAKPMHYAQMISYMGLTHLEDALYVAVNKDNDELYTERIKFSQGDFGDIMDRAKRIIDGTDAARCSKRSDDYRCKACPCHSMCWDDTTIIDSSILFTCRTCCHATADTEHDGANWTCRFGHQCSAGQKACERYMILPSLVRAEVKDGDGNCVNYSVDGIDFSIKKGLADAVELQKIGKEQLSSLNAIHEVIPEAKMISTDSLKVKFSSPDYSEYHKCKVEELEDWCNNNPITNWDAPISTEEHDGVKYYNYGDALITIDNGYASVTILNPPF